jgi:hypothetical protein
VSVPFCNVEHGQRTRVIYQMLHLPRTPDGIEPNFPVVPFDGAQAPQRIFDAVTV